LRLSCSRACAPIRWRNHYDIGLATPSEGPGEFDIELDDRRELGATASFMNMETELGVYLRAPVRVEDADAALQRSPCRVLGKAGLELGGSNIDQWLFQEVLAREGRADSDETVRRLSRSLLVECERAKERLSAYERADIGVTDPNSGATLSAEFNRADLEALLDRHGLALQINRTISRAINLAQEKGYGEDDISAVLMVGGASMMPYVQRVVRSRFAPGRVYLDRPMDAVARGAASFVAGSDFYDHIHHDYAVRWFNPATAKADYKVIIPRGTAYPTPDAIATEVVVATWDGQELLGIFIYEIPTRRRVGYPGRINPGKARSDRPREWPGRAGARRSHRPFARHQGRRRGAVSRSQADGGVHEGERRCSSSAGA
jgi:molecular chaperone DnaK